MKNSALILFLISLSLLIILGLSEKLLDKYAIYLFENYTPNTTNDMCFDLKRKLSLSVAGLK